MRYIRFESQEPLTGPSRLGIFHIAYRLYNAHSTALADANQLAHLLDWLEDNLHVPEELKRWANRRAVCWFKPGAREPIARIWQMKSLIEPYGYWITVRKTWEPGLIVYEDGWQVAAIPRTRKLN